MSIDPISPTMQQPTTDAVRQQRRAHGHHHGHGGHGHKKVDDDDAQQQTARAAREPLGTLVDLDA